MDNIELMTMQFKIFKRISLVKFKRVIRLRIYVHTDNIKTRQMVAHTCTTRTTKQIEQFHLRHL